MRGTTLASAAMGLALWAQSAAASECLDRPNDHIIAISPGVYTDSLRKRLDDEDETLDARGAKWRLSFTGHQKGVTVYPTFNGTCIVGASVVGTQSRTMEWRDVKNSDGVRFAYSESTPGRFVAEGLYVDNVGDGIETVKDSRGAGHGYHFVLRNSYFRDIRDDAIENDTCHSGEIRNVLVDNAFTFLSARPTQGRHLNTGSTAPIITIRDALVHVNAEGGRLFKWPNANATCTPEPRLDIRDSLFRVDHWPLEAEFPLGTFDNVTIVWTGNGSIPVQIPAGVTVTTDLNVWLDARRDWLEAYGCDLAGNSCNGLLGPAAHSPPPLAKPEADEPERRIGGLAK